MEKSRPHSTLTLHALTRHEHMGTLILTAHSTIVGSCVCASGERSVETAAFAKATHGYLIVEQTDFKSYRAGWSLYHIRIPDQHEKEQTIAEDR